MPVFRARPVSLGVKKPTVLHQMRMAVENTARSVVLGTALKLGAIGGAIAAPFVISGCDVAKVECENGLTETVNDGIFGQLTMNMREGKIFVAGKVPIQISGAEAAEKISVVLGTSLDRLGVDAEGKLVLRTDINDPAFEACGASVVDCSPFVGVEHDGKIVIVGMQQTHEGAFLYENVKEGEWQGIWAGIGPMVDRVFGSRVYEIPSTERLAIFATKIDMTSGEPVEKKFYCEVDKEGYPLDNSNNQLFTPEEVMESGKDVTNLLDPDATDPLTPEQLGLNQSRAYFRFNRSEEDWQDKDELGNPIPWPELAGSEYEWRPVIDQSKTLQDIIETMIAEGIDPAEYSIPLRVKAVIRDKRTGSELPDIDLGEFELGDFLRGPIEFELPEEYLGVSVINAEVEFLAEAVDMEVMTETAFVYTTLLRGSVKIDIPGTCEAPDAGGIE